MIYLFFAVLCSSSIALIFKFSESNNLNRYIITSVNYFTAAIIALFLIFKEKIKFFDFNPADFKANFSRVIFRGEGIFASQSSQQWATVVGLVAGVFSLVLLFIIKKVCAKMEPVLLVPLVNWGF